ncbi:hypothetical protein R5R35_002407 [Gryllus longicercus]|uniref:Uncharacterized protein n=1 Tax=Gryllus longicercus TaxID=2509291 RepID=A0AAN9WCB2_9ORTH
MGLPLFYLELIVGQFSGLGANVAFYRMAPLFQGVGYCTLFVIYLITLYYHVITAWTLFYTAASFSSVLGWSNCNHDFNSLNCYSFDDDQECREQSADVAQTFWNRTCLAVKDVCESKGYSYVSGFDCIHTVNGTSIALREVLSERVMASEEFYVDYAMGVRGATWSHWGGMRWEMVGWLALAWVIAYLCLIRGVQSMGKVVYFTALFPYVVLTALLVRGATLDGAADGVYFYMKPDFSELLKPAVWGDAASQTFYALGISCASLVTLSSYNKFNNNCHRDAVFVAIANLLTAIFAGFGVFCVLGVMAKETGQEVKDVVDSGPGLAFIAYPEAISRMPLPQLWAVLFFLMLFVLGLGSQFAGIEAMSAAVLDEWPSLRRRKPVVTACVCCSCFLLALPMCFQSGVYIFTMLDWHTAYWAIFLLGFAEVAVVAYVYGVDRFLDDIASMGMKFSPFTRFYWKAAWLVLAPLTLLGVTAFTLSSFTHASFGSYKFPPVVDAFGWLIGISTLVPLPAFALYRLAAGEQRGWDLLRPLKSWGPQGSAETPLHAGVVVTATVDDVPRAFASPAPSDSEATYDNPAYEADAKAQ